MRPLIFLISLIAFAPNAVSAQTLAPTFTLFTVVGTPTTTVEELQAACAGETLATPPILGWIGALDTARPIGTFGDGAKSRGEPLNTFTDVQGIIHPQQLRLHVIARFLTLAEAEAAAERARSRVGYDIAVVEEALPLEPIPLLPRYGVLRIPAVGHTGSPGDHAAVWLIDGSVAADHHAPLFLGPDTVQPYFTCRIEVFQVDPDLQTVFWCAGPTAWSRPLDGSSPAKPYITPEDLRIELEGRFLEVARPQFLIAHGQGKKGVVYRIRKPFGSERPQKLPGIPDAQPPMDWACRLAVFSFDHSYGTWAGGDARWAEYLMADQLGGAVAEWYAKLP